MTKCFVCKVCFARDMVTLDDVANHFIDNHLLHQIEIQDIKPYHEDGGGK